MSGELWKATAAATSAFQLSETPETHQALLASLQKCCTAVIKMLDTDITPRWLKAEDF